MVNQHNIQSLLYRDQNYHYIILIYNFFEDKKIGLKNQNHFHLFDKNLALNNNLYLS